MLETGVSLTWVMMSPACRPALDAAELSSTRVSITPPKFAFSRSMTTPRKPLSVSFRLLGMTLTTPLERAWSAAPAARMKDPSLGCGGVFSFKTGRLVGFSNRARSYSLLDDLRTI